MTDSVVTSACRLDQLCRGGPTVAGMNDNHKEHCTACGAVPLYRTISTATLNDPSSTQKVAYKCSNPKCENADRRNHTFEWAQ